MRIYIKITQYQN